MKLKKRLVLIVCTMLCALIVFAVGCANTSGQPVIPDPGDGNSNLIINDAYDWNEDGTGSTRPDLDDDYEPMIPPSVYTVTISENCGIRFSGGKTSVTLRAGEMLNLKSEDFDASTLGGRTVAGVAVMNDEGKIRSFSSLEDFNPTSSVTITPYFSPDKGNGVNFGSDNIANPFYNENGTNVFQNPEYKITNELTLIDGYMGNRISCSHALGAESYFRTLSRCAITADTTHVFRYTYVNYGEETVKLAIYQLQTGSLWSNPDASIEAGILELDPGESGSVSVKIRLKNANNNALTVTRLLGDVNGFNLGVVMTEENTTVTPADVTINFRLPEGFAVSDSYERNVKTGDKLRLPTSAQITNNTGHKLLGWVYADSNGTQAEEGTVIKGNITLEPLLSEDIKIQFVDMPEGFTVSDTYGTTLQKGDIFRLPSASQIENKTDRKFLYWEYEEGGRVVDGYALTEDVLRIRPVFAENVTVSFELPEGISIADDYDRTQPKGDKIILPTEQQIENKTNRRVLGWTDTEGNTVNENTVLKGDITLKPELSQIVNVTLDLPTGITVSEDYATVIESGTTLVLPTEAQTTNTTGHNVIGWKDADGNAVSEQTVVRADITISPVLSETATITVKLPSALTLSPDYETTAETYDKLIVPSEAQVSGELPNGRKIEGWCIVGSLSAENSVSGTNVIDENTVVQSKNVTIAPYFSSIDKAATLCNFGNETDGKSLVFCNDNLPSYVNSNGGTVNNNGEDFICAPRRTYNNKIAVQGNADGYAEFGTLFGFNGTIKSGGVFRTSTIISKPDTGAAVVAMKTNHTVYFNFENFGTEDLDFYVQGTNSGADAEGPKTRVQLAPGESVRISFTVNYTKGSANRNILTMFTMNKDTADMRLGVAISVVLDSDNKPVEPETAGGDA